MKIENHHLGNGWKEDALSLCLILMLFTRLFSPLSNPLSVVSLRILSLAFFFYSLISSFFYTVWGLLLINFLNDLFHLQNSLLNIY